MSEGIAVNQRMQVAVDQSAGETLQGWVIISTTWLAVAAAAIVAPVAPQMAAHFAAMPEAEGLVQLGIGLPALFVALFGTPFGYLADKFGRKRVMLFALVAYAVFGMSPLVLTTLPEILLSRAGVGIAEAAVLASGMALLGDLFQGHAREKWYAIQGGTATLVAVVLIAVSGAIGESGWRSPFVIYVAPLIMLAFVVRFNRETAKGQRPDETAHSRLGFSLIARICVINIFTAITFYIVLIQLPFLLVDRGYIDPRMIGLGTAAGALSAPLGAYVFRLMSSSSVATRMTLSFALSGVGLVIIVLNTTYVGMLVGAFVNGIGSGIALPTLMTWAMTGVRLDQRGRMAGIWNGSFFLGQFLSPLVFMGVVSGVGNRATGFGLFAIALVIAAGAAFAFALKTRRG